MCDATREAAMGHEDVYAVSGWELRPLPAYGAALLYLSYSPAGERARSRRLGCALHLDQLMRLRKEIDASIEQLRVRAVVSG
jgi:hypothetical protein